MIRQIPADMPEAERKRYKCVNASSLVDIAGLVMWANVDTGECAVADKTGETKTYSLGERGLRILLR